MILCFGVGIGKDFTCFSLRMSSILAGTRRAPFYLRIFEAKHRIWGIIKNKRIYNVTE